MPFPPPPLDFDPNDEFTWKHTSATFICGCSVKCKINRKAMGLEMPVRTMWEVNVLSVNNLAVCSLGYLTSAVSSCLVLQSNKNFLVHSA